MAKLIFRYGAMGSSKSAQALVVRFNYIERGMHPLLLKPACENRDGSRVLKSRIGLSAEIDYTVEDFLERYSADPGIVRGVDAVIVDEAQFLSGESVDSFSDLVDLHDIPVICYGLRGDFQSTFFKGSKRLMEIADKIEEGAYDMLVRT